MVELRERYIPGKDFESKVRIFEALQSLLCGEEAIELDKVTMKALCDRAGISTRAFYNHFDDKYEVLEWFMELSGADNFAQIGITKTPEEALGAYVCVVDRYRELLRACYRSKHYGAIYAHLVNTIKEGLLEVVAGRCQDGIVPALVAKQIKYFAVVAEAAAFDWIAEGPGGDRGEFAALLVSLMPRDLYELVSDPVSPGGSVPWIDTVKHSWSRFEGGEELDPADFRRRPDGSRQKLREPVG